MLSKAVRPEIQVSTIPQDVPVNNLENWRQGVDCVWRARGVDSASVVPSSARLRYSWQRRNWRMSYTRIKGKVALYGSLMHEISARYKKIFLASSGQTRGVVHVRQILSSTKGRSWGKVLLLNPRKTSWLWSKTLKKYTERAAVDGTTSFGGDEKLSETRCHSSIYYRATCSPNALKWLAALDEIATPVRKWKIFLWTAIL